MSARKPPPATPPPPGARRSKAAASGTYPGAASMPDGVAPPGQRTPRREQPRGFVPFQAPPEPDSQIGMMGVCLVILGVATLAHPLSAGGVVLGVGFTVLGVALAGIWVRLWLLWRAAWGKGRWA